MRISCHCHCFVLVQDTTITPHISQCLDFICKCGHTETNSTGRTQAPPSLPGLCSVPGLCSRTMTKPSNTSGLISFIKRLGCLLQGERPGTSFSSNTGQSRDRTQHPPGPLWQHKWFQHPHRDGRKVDTVASPQQALDRSLNQADELVAFFTIKEVPAPSAAMGIFPQLPSVPS